MKTLLNCYIGSQDIYEENLKIAKTVHSKEPDQETEERILLASDRADSATAQKVRRLCPVIPGGFEVRADQHPNPQRRLQLVPALEGVPAARGHASEVPDHQVVCAVELLWIRAGLSPDWQSSGGNRGHKVAP